MSDPPLPIHPVVMGLVRASAEEKLELEARFVAALEARLGGAAAAAQAYESWLRYDANRRAAPIEVMRDAMRWESSFAEASLAALAEFGERADNAFFLVHRGKSR